MSAGKTYMTLVISDRVFIGEDGERLPVVAAVDKYGEECDLSDAAWCQAGPDKDGLYAQIDMSSQPVLQ